MRRFSAAAFPFWTFQSAPLQELTELFAQAFVSMQKKLMMEEEGGAVVRLGRGSSPVDDEREGSLERCAGLYKAVEDLFRNQGMLNYYASTTTLKTKQDIAPLSIVEFFSKDARNEPLDMLRTSRPWQRPFLTTISLPERAECKQ